MSGRKFKDGDKVIISAKAKQDYQEKYGGKVGNVINYEKSRNYYGTGKYVVDWNGVSNNNDTFKASDLQEAGSGGMTMFSEYPDTLSELTELKTQLTGQLNELRSSLEEVESRIEYIESTGDDSLVESEYRANAIVSIMSNDSLSDIEKAAKISSMMG